MLHRFINISDGHFFRYQNCHAYRLPLLTAFALGMISTDIVGVVIDRTPFALYPFDSSSVLDLSKVIYRNSEIFRDLL
jgi:hypothetical protein